MFGEIELGIQLPTPEWRARLNARVDDLFAFLQPQDAHGDDAADADTVVGKILTLRELCRSTGDKSLSWLLHCAIAGSFPSPEAHLDFHGEILNSNPRSPLRPILLSASVTALRSAEPASGMEFICNGVVVDVTYSCQTDITTGVQRVTRNIISEWAKSKSCTLVRWNRYSSHFEHLAESEATRMGVEPQQPAGADRLDVMVVPINSTVFYPEIPHVKANPSAAGLAFASSNKSVCIGYDLIPVTSAVQLQRGETQKFTSYLSAIKYFSQVIAISESATTEFEGFKKMLSSQGLPGPHVDTLPLPLVGLTERPATVPQPLIKTVLCVGTMELRKNQRRVLAACELLWREGLDFEVCFVGHPSLETVGGFITDIRKAQEHGRAVRALHGISDLELSELYQTAVCSVFVSTHEGYGLPIAESVAAGLPVIATNYGSMAELARHGEHILVDPRSIQEIQNAIRTYVQGSTDNSSAAVTPPDASQSWPRYAEQVWMFLDA